MSRTLICSRIASFTASLLCAACSDAPGPTDQPTPIPPITTVGQLPGAPTAKAIVAVPDSTFRPRSQDYTTGHPDLPGMRVSFNTAVVGVRPDATVGGLNALLQQLGATIVGGLAGTDGGPGALMVLRLPSTSHAAMAQALTALRAAPEVLVAKADIVMSEQSVTPKGNDAVAWNWTSGDYAGDPGLGTWGLAAIRAPQMWNLNPPLRAELRTVETGVLDVGFDPSHEELLEATIVGPPITDAHGNQVASIIGAKQGNNVGIDGTNPFARLVLRAVPVLPGDTTITDASITLGLIELLKERPAISVVNVSLGYKWAFSSLPSVNSDSQDEAARAGDVAELALGILARTRALPVIVTAAGNSVGQQAIFGSGLNNAGLRSQNSNASIIVVEADSAVDGGTSASYGRASLSNISGHISAPGLRVPGAGLGVSTYVNDVGTSFAAPYVTGIVGYLLALEPTLAAPTKERNVIREILVRTGNRGPSRNNQIQVDGFAAALELDVQTGTDRVLVRLLDIDDGTADGNTRIDPFTRVPVLTSDVRADTTIDMSDFRRWRDLVTVVDLDPVVVLDGAPDHPKRDVNGDGQIDDVDGDGAFDDVKSENIFPFADFNGDGRLSLTAVAPMAGVLRARGPLTDLQVLQSRFVDPQGVYVAGDLDLLTASGDVHLRSRNCVPSSGERVRVRLTRTGGGFTKEFIFPPSDSQVVLTVPVLPTPAAVTSYVLRTSRINSAGTELAGRDTTVRLTLAGDIAATPGCAAVLPPPASTATLSVTGRADVGPLDFVSTSVTDGTVSVPYFAKLSGRGTSLPNFIGVITSVPAGISCTITNDVGSGNCSAAFPLNTTVRLIAAGGTGSSFSSWGVPCTLNGNQCVITMSNSGSVRAFFFTGTWSIVTGALADGLTLNSTTGEISGTPTVSTNFADPTVGLITFRLTNGRETVDRSFGVRIRDLFALSVRMSGNGAGSVTISPGGVSCTYSALVRTCLVANIQPNTTLTITATPGANSRAEMSNCTRAAGAPENVCQVTTGNANANSGRFLELGAVFTPLP